MQNPTVLVTGCGYKPVKHIFTYNGKPTHNGIMIDGVENKMNIGTAISFYLAKKGIKVIMVSRNIDNLKKIKDGLIKLGCKKDLISFVDADISTEDGTKKIARSLPKDETIYWVQSIGMGGGTYKLPNDNVYLPFEKIPPELISIEADIATATHRLMLKMVPIFRKQIKKKQKAKIAIITSMSGERGYHFGATHVAAKHALVGYIKGIEMELNDEGVEIYDIRPGGIDTGMYDNPIVKKTVEEISRRTKMWGGEKPIYGEPMAVAKSVYKALFDKKPKKVYRILAPHQK